MLSHIKQFIRFHRIKHLYQKYERILLPATLVFGVLIDVFTFTNINITSTFTLLGIYFFFTSGIIFFTQAYDAKRVPHHRVTSYLRLVSPLILQLAFGALLSGVFIFYFFSGTLFVSWPLLLLLVLLMVSNDVFRKYHARTTIQLGVYYFILFSLSSIILSFLTESLSTKIFLIAGGVSLLFMFAFLELLIFANKDIQKFRLRLTITIFTLFLFLNALYFAKIIPPIPLSLREVTLAHDVSRAGGNYTLQVEEESIWQSLFHGHTFHKDPQGSVYLYTAIFAPGKLKTKIIHDWQYYNEKQKKWISTNQLSFTITGGRKEGYRGYSLKTNVSPGKWRVFVKTENGQVLGRIKFFVENASAVPYLRLIER